MKIRTELFNGVMNLFLISRSTRCQISLAISQKNRIVHCSDVCDLCQTRLRTFESYVQTRNYYYFYQIIHLKICYYSRNFIEMDEYFCEYVLFGEYQFCIFAKNMTKPVTLMLFSRLNRVFVIFISCGMWIFI